MYPTPASVLPRGAKTAPGGAQGAAARQTPEGGPQLPPVRKRGGGAGHRRRVQGVLW